MDGLLTVSVLSEIGEERARAQGGEAVNLIYPHEYRPGDRITLSCSAPGRHLVIRLDDAMEPSVVFLRGGVFSLPVPFGEKKAAYSPKAFSGGLHLLTARFAEPWEIAAYRNLALNVYDCHDNTACFPHARANVETRGESVFAARNAIDGVTANRSHGLWPCTSWGINRDPGAELTLDFGREVEIDRVVLVARADFPHDNWWKSADLVFSDGSALTAEMEKTARPQAVAFAAKRVTWLRLCRLRQDADDPSPFPALSQIEVYGTEAEPRG